MIIWILIAFYFLPGIIAGARHHHNAGSIFVLNLFLGWTFVGWVIALAMACSYVRHEPNEISEESAANSWRAKTGSLSGGISWRSAMVFTVAVLIVLVLGLLSERSRLENDHKEVTPSGMSVEPAPSVEPASPPTPFPSWPANLQVVRPHWTTPEFGMTTWSFRIRNRSKTTAYKDIHFKTNYWAPSGTKVDESLIGHTEYILVPPGKTVSVHFSEFTHSQAARAEIHIDDAKIAYGPP